MNSNVSNLLAYRPNEDLVMKYPVSLQLFFISYFCFIFLFLIHLVRATSKTYLRPLIKVAARREDLCRSLIHSLQCFPYVHVCAQVAINKLTD